MTSKWWRHPADRREFLGVRGLALGGLASAAGGRSGPSSRRREGGLGPGQGPPGQYRHARARLSGVLKLIYQ